MGKISRKDWFRFAVALPEEGDVESMQQILDSTPEHADDLLFGTRPGPDNGNYSAISYSVWLSTLPGYSHAKDVVRWLLTKGHDYDIWCALALEDEKGFKIALDNNPSLVDAKHSLFDMKIVELAESKFQDILIELGADISSPFTQIAVGIDDKTILKVGVDCLINIKDHRGSTFLISALTAGRDSLACKLIEAGANVNDPDGDGYTALEMACVHGCTQSGVKLIDMGAATGKLGKRRGLLRLAIESDHPDVVIIKKILESDASDLNKKIDGKSLPRWCEDNGYIEISTMLREYKKQKLQIN